MFLTWARGWPPPFIFLVLCFRGHGNGQTNYNHAEDDEQPIKSTRLWKSSGNVDLIHAFPAARHNRSSPSHHPLWRGCPWDFCWLLGQHQWLLHHCYRWSYRGWTESYSPLACLSHHWSGGPGMAVIKNTYHAYIHTHTHSFVARKCTVLPCFYALVSATIKQQWLGVILGYFSSGLCRRPLVFTISRNYNTPRWHIFTRLQ